MTFNLSKCQEIFQNRFTGDSGVPFKDFNGGKKIRDVVVDPVDLAAYTSYREDDLINFYYKSLLSFSEGVAAIQRKNYTWATIKLYYSVYFGLRCSLLCRNTVLVRAPRFMFRFKLSPGSLYIRADDTTDHGGTIETYIKEYGKTDFLCSSKVDEKNPYLWLKECREIVNYRDEVFHDPFASDLWETIEHTALIDGMKKTLNNYIVEMDKYCFLPETAVLAVPLNRILTTAQDVKNEVTDCLEESQKEWIKSILVDVLDEQYINKLLFNEDDDL